MGWAHNYSLPREISLDANGKLVQKPNSGLSAMRQAEGMSGRQLELLGEFTVPNGTCGFHFLKSGDRQATLSYDPATGVLTLDYTTLPRVSTDNGLWSAALPKKVAVGEKLTLHLFLDGSIVDIFVNDTWAFSTRIFPTDAEAIAAEAFGADNASIKGWVLDAKQTASNIGATLVNNGIVNSAVYDLQGRMLSPLTSKKRLSVSLTGNCITSEETLLKQFPIRVDDHIRLSTNRFDLGRMRKGESKERGVVVLYSDTKRQERIPVRFTVNSKTPKGLQHIAYPLEIKGKKVMITLDVFVY